MKNKTMLITRCPICGDEERKAVAADFKMKNSSLIHRVCLGCSDGLQNIVQPQGNDMFNTLTRFSEDGNPNAIGLFRYLIGKRGRHSGPYCFYGGLKDSEVRELILTLRRNGTTGREILQAIKEKWPNDPTKWVSRSALYRFFERARKGRLKEFGIEIT